MKFHHLVMLFRVMYGVHIIIMTTISIRTKKYKKHIELQISCGNYGPLAHPHPHPSPLPPPPPLLLLQRPHPVPNKSHLVDLSLIPRSLPL